MHAEYLRTASDDALTADLKEAQRLRKEAATTALRDAMQEMVEEIRAEMGRRVAAELGL